MNIIRSLISAFSMYSAIPMPRVEWSEENHRWSLCFFPLIGAVIGWLYLIWYYICDALSVGQFLKGAVCACIPIFVTGGIHADGFCDVTDARFSYGDRSKRLSIMSDPHSGAFAVIYMAVYLLLQAAVFSEIRLMTTAIVTALCFVMSRCVSGIAAVTMKCAKREGTLQSFSRPADKTTTIVILSAVIAAAYTLMLITDIWSGTAAAGAIVLCTLYYRLSAYRRFGGITGDTEGWFLQICEIAAPAAALLAEAVKQIIAGGV